MTAEETKREKARQLRYKRAIVKNINIETITEELWDIQEECNNVQYYFDTEDDTLLNALDGDEEQGKAIFPLGLARRMVNAMSAYHARDQPEL